MKHNQNIPLLLLAAALLTVVSCSDTDAGTTGETAAADAQTTAVTAPDMLDFLPEDLDWGGQTINILHAQNINVGDTANEVTYLLDEIEGGDIVAEAVYDRTRLVEERLNLTIKSDKIDWGDGLTKALRDSAMADSGDFSAVCGRQSTISQSLLEGYLADLRTIETLNLEHSWWDQTVNSSMLIDGRQYMMTGDINYYDDYAIICMTFNKTWFINQGIDMPYDLVRDGTWTFDALYELVHQMGEDVNGDSKYDENDKYGMIVDRDFLAAAVIGFGESLTTVEQDGARVLNQSETLINKVLKVIEAIPESNTSILIKNRKFTYEIADKIFPDGKAMVGNALVGSFVDLRGMMEDDFGVLPNPKYDEEQESYYHAINPNWASVYAVPVNCRDLNMTGYILDTMGCLSVDTVTEAVIEKNVMIKSSRDEDSEEMLRLIFKSKVADPALIYGWNIDTMYQNMCTTANTQVASTLQKNAKSCNRQIAKFTDAIANLS